MKQTKTKHADGEPCVWILRLLHNHGVVATKQRAHVLLGYLDQLHRIAGTHAVEESSATIALTWNDDVKIKPRCSDLRLDPDFLARVSHDADTAAANTDHEPRHAQLNFYHR